MLWAIMFIPDLLTYPGDKFKRLALGVTGALDELVVYDVGTDTLAVYPAASNSAHDTEVALVQCLG